MKILKLSPYCFPEKVSSSHLGRDLNEAYARAGITVENHVPTPTRGIDAATRAKYKKIRYEEQYDGHVVIRRFPLFREGKNPLQRALRYFLCHVIQYFKGIRARDIDLVFAGSTPPTQGVLCALVSKRLSKKYKKKVPFVYNLQDIFPDSMVNAGMTKKGSLLWKLGRKIEDYTYRSADAIIVISESFKRNILAKGVPEEKIVVISNWIDSEKVQPVEKKDNRLYEEFGLSGEKFTVVYAGNFGASQGADVVLEAAALLEDDPDIQFVIFGGGAEFAAAAEKAAGMKNVWTHSLLPQERVPEVYSLGDVALIVCKKGVGNAGMPSKTWSIMACNTPIIASFDLDSELASLLEETKTGITVEPGNAEALAEAIRAQKASGVLAASGRSYIEKYADTKVCVKKYIETMQDVVKDGRK